MMLESKRHAFAEGQGFNKETSSAKEGDLLQHITINDVRYAMHHALEAAFPTVTISSVEPNPPIDTPYCLVRLLEFTQAQELGNRYRRSFPFSIVYMDAEQEMDDKYRIAEEMIAAVKELELGSSRLSGQNVKVEIIEGKLHLFITYTMLVREQQLRSPIMKNLEEGIVVD